MAVVTTRAEECLLRDADVGADGDGLKIEQPGAFADPGSVTDGEFPWPMNTHPVADEHTLADLGAEGSQDRHSQFGRAPPSDKDGARDEHPERLNDLVSADFIASAREAAEVTGARHGKIVGD